MARYVVLARDPEEKVWTILHQGDASNEAINFWLDNPGDNSERICVDTENFITFPYEEQP